MFYVYCKHIKTGREEFGAKKYGDYNWAKGLSIKEICESLKRHLDAFMEGEDDDPESKLSHIGHIQLPNQTLTHQTSNYPTRPYPALPRLNCLT